MGAAKLKKKNGQSGHTMNGNGFRDTGPRVSLAPLDEMQKGEIRALHNNLNEARVQLANLQVQLMLAEQNRIKLAETCMRADESLVSRIKAMAVQRGLSAENFRFDVNTMEFAQP